MSAKKSVAVWLVEFNHGLRGFVPSADIREVFFSRERAVETFEEKKGPFRERSDYRIAKYVRVEPEKRGKK